MVALLNKLILANLAHRPVRTVLSVLAIAVEVTMILTLVGVSNGVGFPLLVEVPGEDGDSYGTVWNM